MSSHDAKAPLDIGFAYQVQGQLLMPHYDKNKAQHYVAANGEEWTADQLHQMGGRRIEMLMWPREWQQTKWKRGAER
jgi:hypothetical protein